MVVTLQVLGRNLEAMVTRAQAIKEQWKDKFVSVEHLVLAYLDDARFGQRILKEEGLDYDRLASAIKDIRGSNAVTDQVCVCFASLPPTFLETHNRHMSPSPFGGMQERSKPLPCRPSPEMAF